MVTLRTGTWIFLFGKSVDVFVLMVSNTTAFFMTYTSF